MLAGVGIWILKGGAKAVEKSVEQDEILGPKLLELEIHGGDFGGADFVQR